MYSQTRSQFPLSSNPRSLSLKPASSISGPSRKATRKPVFRIFCDDDIYEPTGDSSKLKPVTALHAVVNDKENQVPELNNRTISASRQTNPSSTRSRVLGDKTFSASARVNCVDKWDSQIPFAPCAPSLEKSAPIHPIKTEKPRVTPHPESVRRTKHQPKIAASPTQPAKRLSSHIYYPGSEKNIQGSSNSLAHDDGLNELVSKLEALQANNDDDVALEMLEPLPPNAACPGAPKMPNALTMPAFVTDAGHCDDDQTLEFKLPSSHQMSPLAEVTEAFTGLQGGWSPPLETSSPVFKSHFFENISVRPEQS